VRNLTPTTWICLAGLAAVLTFAIFGEEAIERALQPRVLDENDNVAGADMGRLPLPAAPERVIVEKYCQTCHHLTRVEKAGGTVEDWTSRIDRMIKNGATIPRADVPTVAAYLAYALPPRPRQPSDLPPPS